MITFTLTIGGDDFQRTVYMICGNILFKHIERVVLYGRLYDHDYAKAIG